MQSKVGFSLVLVFLALQTCFSQFISKQVSSSKLDPIYMVNSSTGYVGGIGEIYKTTNGGVNWSLLPYFVSTYNSFDSIYFVTMVPSSIRFLDVNVGYAVGWGAMGNYEQIIKTADGGITWQLQHLDNPDTAPFQAPELRLQDIHAFDANTLITVGYRGRILKTTNGGTNWSVKNSTTSNNLVSVAFRNANDGIIAGEGIILRTTDGGESWTSESSPYTFKDIIFLTDQEVIAITNTKIIKSYDGGQTWSASSVPASTDFKSLAFINSTTGFVGGGNYLLKTTNAGATFEKVAFSSFTVSDVHATAAEQVFLSSEQGKVISSTGTTINYFPIASFSLSAESLCMNQQLTATNESYSGQTYAWYVDGVLVSNSYHLNHTFSSSGSHSVTLMVTLGLKSDSYTRYVTVNPLPTSPTFKLQANNTEICLGDAVYLYVYNSYETFTLYNSANTVLGTVNQTGKPFYFNNTTTVHIAKNVTNDCGTLNMVDSLTITVVPKPSPTRQVIINEPSLCYGDSTYIEIANSEIGITYSLTESHAHDFDLYYTISASGNGGTLKLKTPAIKKNTSFELRGKNSLGCSAYYGLHTITIRTFTADFTAGPRFLNTGSPLRISNTSTADSYEWTFGDNASPMTSTAVTPAPIYTVGGEKIIRVKAIVNEGCSKTMERKVWVMDPAASTTISQDGRYSNLLDTTYHVNVYKLVNGNHYFAGYIGGPPTTYNGERELFIAKFNSSGVLQWMKKRLNVEYNTYGLKCRSEARALTIDGDENIFLAGNYQGNQFSIGDSIIVSKRPNHLDETKGVLMKMDKNGKIKWINYFECAETITSTYPSPLYSQIFPTTITLIKDSLFVDLNTKGPQPQMYKFGEASSLYIQDPQYSSIMIKLDTSGHYFRTLRSTFMVDKTVAYHEGDKIFNVVGSNYGLSVSTIDLRFNLNKYYAQTWYNRTYFFGKLPVVNGVSAALAEPDHNQHFATVSVLQRLHETEEYIVVGKDTTLASSGSVVTSHDKLQRLNWFHFLPYADIVDSETIGTSLYVLGNYRGYMGSTLPNGGHAGMNAPDGDASVFLAKYDATGNLQWINNLDGGAGNDVALSMEKDPCTNNLIVLASRATGLYLTNYSLDQDLPQATCFQAGFTTSFPDILVGESVQFTDVSIGNPSSWQWTFEGANTTTFDGQSPPPIVYSVPGDYKVSLTISGSGNSSTRTLEKYISVHKPLKIVAISASTQAVTAGGYVDFTAITEGDPLIYEWYFDGAGIGYGMGGGYLDGEPVHVRYPKVGTFKVTLTIRRYGRSVSTIEYGYITVYPSLTADFNASETTISTGQSVTFTNISQGNVTAYKWTFQGGTPSTSTEANPVVTYNTPGYYDVELQVFSGEETRWKKQFYYIWVRDKMEANFTASKTTINPGESINFTSLSAGIPQVYAWTFQGGTPATSSLANPTNIKYNTAGVYRVSLTVTSGGDVHTKTVEEYITVLGSLSADFTSSKTAVVAGESINFTNQSAGAPSSSQWTFEGATTTTSNSANPSNITYASPGTFDVALSISKGTETKSKLKSDFITVYPVIEPNFSVDRTEIQVGETVVFQNLSTGGAETFQWTFSGTDNETVWLEQPAGITYNYPGEFNVTLKASGNIQSKEIVKTKLIKVSTITGVDDAQEGAIVVYPNPSDGKFQINGVNGKYSIELYNTVGKKVYSAMDLLSEIDVEIPPGIYILKIFANSRTYIRRVSIN